MRWKPPKSPKPATATPSATSSLVTPTIWAAPSSSSARLALRAQAAQTGNNNIVTSTQAGANETFAFGQNGNGNNISNGQSTAGDMLTAMQTGNANMITSSQFGEGSQTASMT